MKFKHHSGIRLALTSGHITCVGTDWQTLLPLFHAEALARGCHCERPLAPSKTQIISASTQAVTPLDEASAIAAGMSTLLKQGHNQGLTADGLPDMDVLSAQVGFTVEKDQALAVGRHMQSAPLAPGSVQASKPAAAKKRSSAPKASPITASA